MLSATTASGPAAMPPAAAAGGGSVTPPTTGAAAQGGPRGNTPLANRPVTLGAPGVGSGPPQQAQVNAELTIIAAAMEASKRAIEQWIIAAAIPALDDHGLKLDALQVGQAQPGGPGVR